MSQLAMQLQGFERGSRNVDPGEVDDWLAYSLSLLRFIRQLDSDHRLSLLSGAQLDRVAVVKINELYDLWYEGAGHTLEDLDRLEAQGQRFSNARQFRVECITSPWQGISANALATDHSGIQQGRIYTPEELRNELRD